MKSEEKVRNGQVSNKMGLVDFKNLGRKPLKDYKPRSRFDSSLFVPVPLWAFSLSD